MTIALGIDTGGTYTDAVLVEHDSGTVLAAAKALTTRRDLAIGIKQAIAAVLEQVRQSIPAEAVELVGLSTTLATNAIVEGQGSPVCLLLLGYDADLVAKYGFQRELVTRDVIYLPGRFDGMGSEIEPLDETATRQAILARAGQVEAFAISGYFSVLNPTHEVRVRSLVEELTRQPDGRSLPTSCGHELTHKLNAIRRATTATLNARLIPLLQELIDTVQHSLLELGIHAPLMVVKGDGSLVQAGWAIRRPIETILSGPAASVVGAHHLTRRGDVWVVDVGGTTTDIARLTAGRPRINPEGAQVGPWRTMVEAVDVHTVGLGGDSQVTITDDNSQGQQGLDIGPRRVVPLSLLASQYPQIVIQLKAQLVEYRKDSLAGQFIVSNRRAGRQVAERDLEMLERLEAGPRSIIELADATGRPRYLLLRQLERLAAERLVLPAGFTPTDALHALGLFERWDASAAVLGAELLAARNGQSAEALCRTVINRVSDQVATELVSKVLADEAVRPNWAREPAATALVARAFGRVTNSALDCHLGLNQPIAGIGAPVLAYLPRTAQQLRTDLVTPDHAGVANAVGAVVGGVIQQIRVTIHLLEAASKRFRVHLPDGVCDFAHLEAAVAHAQAVVPAQLEDQARAAGAVQIEIKVARHDNIAPIRAEWGGQLYLGTELVFTAMGRPALA